MRNYRLLHCCIAYLPVLFVGDYDSKGKRSHSSNCRPGMSLTAPSVGCGPPEYPILNITSIGTSLKIARDASAGYKLQTHYPKHTEIRIKELLISRLWVPQLEHGYLIELQSLEART